MERFDILIIGAGAAGLSAAREAAKCARVLIADRRQAPGGILLQCAHKGFAGENTGPEYAALLAAQLPKSAELRLNTTVLSVSPDKTAVLSSPAHGLQKAAFGQLILAAGCRETPMGALPITGTRPAGVYTAGQAQELINIYAKTPKGPVVILGSGDLGLIMARRFTLCGEKVAAVVEQKSACGGMARNRAQCIEPYGIRVICSATVTKVHGEERVTGVTVRHAETAREELIPCAAFVTAAGLIPDRELAHGLAAPGWLHICGNCRRVHDMVESVALDGARAGAAAAKNVSLRRTENA